MEKNNNEYNCTKIKMMVMTLKERQNHEITLEYHKMEEVVNFEFQFRRNQKSKDIETNNFGKC